MKLIDKRYEMFELLSDMFDAIATSDEIDEIIQLAKEIDELEQKEVKNTDLSGLCQCKHPKPYLGILMEIRCKNCNEEIKSLRL